MDKKYKKVNGIPFAVGVEVTNLVAVGVDSFTRTVDVDTVEITTVVIEVLSGRTVVDKQCASSRLKGELGVIEALTRALSLTELPAKKTIVKNYIETCLV
mgnify:FL=1